MELRTEKHKRKQPPDFLFFWGSLVLLDYLLPIQHTNIWITVCLAVGLSVVITLTLFFIIHKVKGWYYTKWVVFILIFTLGMGLAILK